jgi:flagellar biosynthesis/type III secretory pathway chaperone
MEIMREELSLYVELFNIKRQERPCLAAGAVTELQKITDDLQVVVDKIKRAEKSRAEEMDRWAKVVGCGPSHVTLRMIAQQVSPEEGQTLIEVGDQLKALVITVRDENNVNQLLLRRSLRLANDEIRILINSEEESGAYSAQGSVSPQRTPCGRRLVDCRA